MKKNIYMYAYSDYTSIKISLVIHKKRQEPNKNGSTGLHILNG